MLALAVGEWLSAASVRGTVCFHLLPSELHKKGGMAKEGGVCIGKKKNKEEITPLLPLTMKQLFQGCQSLCGAHSEWRMAVKLAVSEMPSLLSCLFSPQSVENFRFSLCHGCQLLSLLPVQMSSFQSVPVSYFRNGEIC